MTETFAETGSKATIAHTSRSSTLSPKHIFRESSKLSGANLINALILFFVNLFVARSLGPELLGVIGYITLWQFYANLSKPGIFSTAYREMPGLISRGKIHDAIRIQNIGITAEAVYLILPTMIMLISGLMQSNPILRNGLILGALVFIITQARDYMVLIQWSHQRFSIISRANIVAGLSVIVFVSSTIGWLKVYTPLLIPMVMALSIILYYWKLAPSAGLRLCFDRPETLRMLRIGIPLALGTLFYWGFRTVDRTAVVASLSLVEIGYFTFVMQFINLGILFVSDFGNVTQPKLWSELDKTEDVRNLGPQVTKLSFLIFGVTCFIVNLAQAGFGAFVHTLVPKFVPSIAGFEILIFLLVCATAGIIPSHLLNSSRLNKQGITTMLWGSGLALNIIVVFFAVYMGWGLQGIALASVASQAIMAAVFLFITRKYIFTNAHDMGFYYALLLGLFFITIITYILNRQFLPYNNMNIFQVATLRFVLVFMVWGALGSVLYKYRESMEWKGFLQPVAEQT